MPLIGINQRFTLWMENGSEVVPNPDNTPLKISHLETLDDVRQAINTFIG
jgi:hypothetical protein